MKTITYGKQNIDSKDIKAVIKVLNSVSITQGKIVNEFGNKIFYALGIH